MSKKTRERIILGLLLAVLTLALWNVWGRLRPSTVAQTPPSTQDMAATPPVDTDQFSSLDISQEWASGIAQTDDVEQRNPFQYGGGTPSPRASVPPPPQPAGEFPRPAPPIQESAPPPPLPLQYVGHGRVGDSGQLTAVLIGEDGLPYTAVAGETLMGRYRLEEVTEEFVVVEEVQSGRRERLLVNLEK